MFARPFLRVERGRRRPLVGYGVLKRENKVRVTRGMLFPLLPFGKSSVL